MASIRTKTKKPIGPIKLVYNDPKTYTKAITESANRFFLTDAERLAIGSGGSLPNQAGHAGEYLTTDGVNPSWGVVIGVAAWGGITGTLSNQADLQAALNAKQATLISGTNIKTVNSTSLLGSGNVAVEPVVATGTVGQYYRGDKTWQTLTQNATHTGEVTGATALTVDKTAITGKGVVTAVGADYVLISDTSDSGNLKKALVSDLIGTGTTNLAYDSATRIVSSDTGSDATLTLADATNPGLMTTSQFNKLGFISITQAVDLDVLESDTVTNNAKVTNATHTGEVTGAGALTLDKTAITNRSTVSVDNADFILISDTSDSANLKKVAVSDIRPTTLSIKEVEINFGTTPTIDKAFVITDAAIGTLSKIVILPSGSLATGQVGVDFAVEAVQFVAKPGVGQFTIYALSLGGYLTGARKVFYIHN